MTLFSKIKKVFFALLGMMIFYVFVLFFTAVAVFTFRGYTAIKQSQSMMIEPDSIEFVGNSVVSQSDLLLLAALDAPISYIDVSPERIEKLLSVHPWISEALVTAVPPNSLTVFIVEHKAEAWVTYSKKQGAIKTPWFSDENGFLFKKVFPGEKGLEALPLISLNSSLNQQQRTSVVITALALIDRWKGRDSSCFISEVHFSVVEGFSATTLCDQDSTELVFSDLHKDNVDEVSRILHKKFNTISARYYAQGKWIGEYVFGNKSDNYRVIIGKIREISSHVEK